MKSLFFVVYGHARTQGSKRVGGNGRVIDQNGKALKEWRDLVSRAAAASAELEGWVVPAPGAPIRVSIRIYHPRPKSHRNRDGSLNSKATAAPFARGDVDKLARAVLDAITGPAIPDDRYITDLSISKQWSHGDRLGPHAFVRIYSEETN